MLFGGGGGGCVGDGLANMNVSLKQKKGRKDGAYQGRPFFFLWEQQFLIASYSNETILCSYQGCAMLGPFVLFCNRLSQPPSYTRSRS